MPHLSFPFISFFYTTLNITTDMCRKKRERGRVRMSERKCWNITHQDYCTLSQTSSFMSNICFISSPFCEKRDRWDEKRDAYKKLCDQINVYSVYFTISFNSHLAKKWQNETSLGSLMQKIEKLHVLLVHLSRKWNAHEFLSESWGKSVQKNFLFFVLSLSAWLDEIKYENSIKLNFFLPVKHSNGKIIELWKDLWFILLKNIFLLEGKKLYLVYR